MKKENDILETIELRDCPLCGGPSLIEEENDWCLYAACLDCGCHTAIIGYNSEEERAQAAEKAAYLWNQGKVVSLSPGE